MKGLLFASIAVGFSIASLKAQTTLVSLLPDGVNTNEPCIAIDPNNPSVQILGSNNFFFFVSNDGGYSWTPRSLFPPEGFYGDPVVFINKKGTQFLVHLAKNPKKPWPEHFDQIVVERSLNGGASYTSTGVGLHEGKMQDKPWIAIDENKKSKYRDNVYVSWTEFDKYGSFNPMDSSRIRVAVSRDEGATFDSVVVVNDICGDAKDGDSTLEGATIAFGKAGEVFVAWAGASKIWFDQSFDGGKTWGKDRVIESQIGGWDQQINGVNRSNSMPFLRSNNKGILYLVFGDARNGDYDVFYKYSKNQGKDWSPAIRINNDALKNGKDQYMPALATDRKTGHTYVTWYDRRHSENNLYTDVYVAQINEEKIGKQLRLTNTSFCPPGKSTFFGDYISIDAAKGEIRVAATLFDHDRQIPTVKVGLLKDRILKRLKSNTKPPYIEVYQLSDTALLSVHFELPGFKSCTLKMARGGQMFYTQLFEELNNQPQELLLPMSRFNSGVYHITLSFKGKSIEKDVYIKR